MTLPQINKQFGFTQCKLTQLSMATLACMTLGLTGCMGTKYLSEGISDEGHVEPQNIVFPELDDAWQKQGQFPNRENLSKIRAGVVKDELYQLIGRPHFSEAQHAREWDYIMKFYQEDDSVKVCQYKVIFDKDYRGQEFYWQPADCAKYAKLPTAAPVATPAIATPIIKQEKITLAADALFKFDQWKTSEMLTKGRQDLDELAQKLIDYSRQGDARIIITGHTDYLGDDAYNMNLSQLRAQTVRRYLIEQGVDASTMIAMGAGESEPVKQCSANVSRQALIDCLQPNRRVEVSVSLYR